MSNTGSLLSRRRLQMVFEVAGLHLGGQGRMIIFEGQHVVRSCGLDFRGDLPFDSPSRRLSRRLLPASISRINSGIAVDFVRFRGGRHLAQGQAVFRGPGGSRCAREIFRCPVECAAQCLAVNRRRGPPSEQSRKVVDPVPQTCAKHGGFQPGKHAAERIRAEGMPFGNSRNCSKNARFRFPYRSMSVNDSHSRQYAANGQHDHINEPMQLATLHADRVPRSVLRPAPPNASRRDHP